MCHEIIVSLLVRAIKRTLIDRGDDHKNCATFIHPVVDAARPDYPVVSCSAVERKEEHLLSLRNMEELSSLRSLLIMERRPEQALNHWQGGGIVVLSYLEVKTLNISNDEQK